MSHPTRPFSGPRLLPLALLALLVLLAAAPALADDAELAKIEALIDAGEGPQALALLQKTIKGQPSPREQMLRGSARILLGELKTGGNDLEEALRRDPTLRRGWMNLAALDIAEGKFAVAYESFKKAQALDPNAADSYLNLGACLIMMGRSAEARDHFDRYLALQPTAENYYLVAANYALGKAYDLVVKTLEKAIAIDEKMRLRARRDDRFLLVDTLEYRVLLFTDNYQPPADHYQTAAAYKQSYSQQNDKLVRAALEGLRRSGLRYEQEVEATARWVIVWGDLRMKIANQENGTGVISLSAPKNRFTPELWSQKTQEVFRSVLQILGESP
jgi:tetratricopeptide (TPR) repeat protein